MILEGNGSTELWYSDGPRRSFEWGSGAIEASRQIGRVLNIDIGGGTTKLSVIESRTILESSVVRVGSRGIVTDDDRIVTRVEVSGTRATEALGLRIDVGSEVSE